MRIFGVRGRKYLAILHNILIYNPPEEPINILITLEPILQQYTININIYMILESIVELCPYTYKYKYRD